MTMPGYRTHTPSAPPERGGLAKASLVLGIIGLIGLALCLLGIVPAAVGVVLGIVSVRRGEGGRRTAGAGIAVSAVALVLGAVALFWLLDKAAQCGDESLYPDDAARQQCVEREFPFAKETATP
ncbi:DUF4190 domain-containing protein [Actinomadura xylanilytica]|uniref:DUF4190 domain-containing protein n=1 Tax=Actinomadura xylanilytica TaxID=887459 RepID=UPI00255AE052|nr:DUF4190 domain-containing protein [Actinomadura xylanilytica]MDL4773813.1 DUF4190 domain-containing protein [Actinomadura xylanilytica]